jgi:hypothetical protein
LLIAECGLTIKRGGSWYNSIIINVLRNKKTPVPLYNPQSAIHLPSPERLRPLPKRFGGGRSRRQAIRNSDAPIAQLGRATDFQSPIQAEKGIFPIDSRAFLKIDQI